MTRALPLTALCIALVLAGCGAPVADTSTTAPRPTTAETSEPTTIETTTAPTPTTTDGTAAPADADYPPGVTAEGVENASRLLDAHEASVAAQGAHAVAQTTIDGVVRGEAFGLVSQSVVRFAPNGTRVYWTNAGVNSIGNETSVQDTRYYANETAVATRVVQRGNATVRERNRSDLYDRVLRNAATQRRLLQSALANADYAVAGAEERNGTTVTTLVAENGTYDGDQPVTAFDATLELSESGRVLSVTRTRTLRTDASVEHHRTTVTWRPVALPVSPPAWTPWRQ
ncbi:hypothetical protein [Salarchaeum japonicum]|uniref:Uncharacterized protein n=1 Tax=Salarchaeum japonicum TaxID=555573 RepID=A0AAV3SWT2_9EURY|nr:hypothetical protein [Salarchaeum japonicum]